METKPLLYGLIGFFIGGLIVSVAATTIEKPQTSHTEMSQMTSDLQTKSGDDYDKAFIAHMIAHHQAAVDMAKLSAERSSRQEVKDMSNAIITAQEKEISDMRMWQTNWETDQEHHNTH